MPPMPCLLRAMGSRMTLVLLILSARPLPGFAQATGGLTTSLAMATEAAIRAVTEPAYPAAAYAGRDDDRSAPLHRACPSPTRSAGCCGSTSASRSPAGSTSPTPPKRHTSTMTPSAIPAPAAWCGPTVWVPRRFVSPARPGKSSSGGSRTMRPDDFPASARVADTELSLTRARGAPGVSNGCSRPPGGRPPGAGRRDAPHGRASGVSDGVRRRPHLHRDLQALLRPRGGHGGRRWEPQEQAHPRQVDRVPALGDSATTAAASSSSARPTSPGTGPTWSSPGRWATVRSRRCCCGGSASCEVAAPVVALHSGHDPARSRAAPFTCPRSRGHAVRLDGPAGGPPVSAETSRGWTR